MTTDRIIRIKVDPSDATRGINQVEGNMQRLGTTVSKVAAGVAAAIAGGAMAKFLNDSAQAARNFEASISNLSAITGATGKDLEFLRQAALDFGATTTLSASQAAEALKLVASAKPDLLESGEALKEVTRQAILLAEASGSTLADAAKTVGNALNQFGEDADQAARFVNVLAAGAKFGSSEIEQTAVALRDSGVAAASAGISFEQTNAAIQVLASTGLSGAQSGTALRNIFLKLDNDVDKNLRPSVVGLEQALKNLNAQNLDGAELVKRFGLENIVAGQTLLNNTDKLGELTVKLTGTNTAIEQAETNNKNLNGSLKQLASAYEALQIQVGSKFLGTLTNLTDQTTSLIQAIGGNEEALAKWGGTFEVILNVAMLTTAVVGARLTAALVMSMRQLYLNAGAALAAKTTYDAFGLAVTRTTVAANVGAVAMRGLGGALALVGGPLGAAILAAGGLAFFVTQAVISQRETERLAREASGLNKELLETNRIYELYAQKQSEVTAGALSGLGQDELQAQFDKSTKLIEIYQRRLDQLKESGASLARQSDVEERLKQEQRVLEEIAKAIPGVKASAAATDDSAEKSAGLAEKLGDLAAKISLSSVEYAVFAERQRLVKEGFSTAEIEAYIGSFRQLLQLQQAPQDEQTAARINARIEGLRLEAETISSQLELQRAVRLGFFSQEAADLAANTAQRILELNNERDLVLAEQALTNEQKLALEDAYQSQLTAITRQYSDGRIEVDRLERLTRLDLAQSFANSSISLIAAFGSKSFQAQKNAAIASGIVNIAGGVAKALNNPYPANLGFAAQVAAQGAGLISTIKSTNVGSGGGSGFGGGFSSSQALPTQPQAAPQVGSFEISGLADLQQQLNDLDNDEVLPVSFTKRLVASLNSVQRLEGGG